MPSILNQRDKMSLLRIKELSVEFKTEDNTINAVDNVNLSVDKGETLCIVGESGCGKSVTALSIMRLLKTPPAKISSGEIFFNKEDILKLNSENLRKIRGNKIAMIFQDPMTSLNPVFTCGDQISEAIMAHEDISKNDADIRTVELLKLVQIPEPQQRFKEYPHQLSGGMRQRVMIAMALSCNPDILIADEPTTALDVTVQAQILKLLSDIKKERDLAIIFITHDFGVVAQIADRISVLYAGKVVESATAEQIFNNPKHPYTVGLLKSVPHLASKKEELFVIPGSLPDPTNHPKGCRFASRCSRKIEECETEYPENSSPIKQYELYCFNPFNGE